MTHTVGTSGEARTQKKDVSIQALRGLAVLLMVAGHVIGTSSDRGMSVSDDSLWRLSYLVLEDIRMPLFTVLSGYVYAMRPVTETGALAGLLRGKIRRLIVPLLTVGALLFAMKLIVPDTNTKPKLTEFWRVYVFGYEHLWFLQSIFIIFLVVALLGAFGALTTPARWATCTAVTLALFVAVRVPEAANVFSINGAIRLLPFFLIGYGLYTFASITPRGWGLVAVTAAFAAVYAVRVTGILNDWELDAPLRRALSLTVGVGGILLIYSVRKFIAFKWLAWIGGFSFGVYLLHVFGAAGARIALGKVGIDWDPAVFLVCLAVGVGAPIVFQLLFGRWNIVRTLLLGEKPLPRSRQEVTAEPSESSSTRIGQ
ncbi:acyltransferase [Rhodococcus pyridinivorans]|uniref:acyltransferase family protein n=1 Tax=Rhodococcus pyridinivorans TaxID=103816 RepID=UPI001FFFECB9|nr:acyltransferase [Rhodococcus pyridinivorans]UPK64905.1 acyltransferase [Rhodococcus pyridinivorans]